MGAAVAVQEKKETSTSFTEDVKEVTPYRNSLNNPIL